VIYKIKRETERERGGEEGEERKSIIVRNFIIPVVIKTFIRSRILPIVSIYIDFSDILA